MFRGFRGFLSLQNTNAFTPVSTYPTYCRINTVVVRRKGSDQPLVRLVNKCVLGTDSMLSVIQLSMSRQEARCLFPNFPLFQQQPFCSVYIGIMENTHTHTHTGCNLFLLMPAVLAFILYVSISAQNTTLRSPTHTPPQ